MPKSTMSNMQCLEQEDEDSNNVDDDMGLIDWNCLFLGFSIVPRLVFGLVRGIFQSLWQIIQNAVRNDKKKFY